MMMSQRVNNQEKQNKPNQVQNNQNLNNPISNSTRVKSITSTIIHQTQTIKKKVQKEEIKIRKNMYKNDIFTFHNHKLS